MNFGGLSTKDEINYFLYLGDKCCFSRTIVTLSSFA